MIKLVLTDLDDTLIPFGASGVSDFARAAIHELLDAGVRFGPVTGRPHHSMSWMFGSDPACYATGAFANGQVIYIDGQHRRTVEISRELMEQAIREVDEIDGVLLAHIDLDDPSKSGFVTYHPERLESIPQDFDYAKSLKPGLGEGPFVKGALIFTRREEAFVTEVKDLLNERIPGLEFYRPSNVVSVLDFSPRGWTKASAVFAVTDELGISADEICVFGDTENDVPMLEAVPHSVAVGNASDGAKAAAKYQIGPCDEESVGRALLEIAAASRRGELPAFLQ